MSNDKMKKIVKREMVQLNEKRKLLSVFDDANTAVYRRHRKSLRCPTKKVDNDSPMIGSSSFFAQSKIDTAQRRLKQRMKDNLHLVTYFNLIQRSKGKVDSYNPIAAFRSSKLKERIEEQQHIDFMNKIFSKVIKSKPPTEISNSKLLSDEYHLFMRPVIIRKMKYAIAIETILLPEIDTDLECPPSPEEYKNSTKILMNVQILNHGDMGSIKIMLNSEHEKLVDSMCESASKFDFRPIYVFRVLKGIFIEFSNIPQLGCGCEIPSNATTCCKGKVHLPVGTVSLITNDNGKPTTKFSISLKKLTKLYKNQIVIGRVVKGTDVLKAIETFGSPGGPPIRTILVNSCKVF